MPFGIHLPPYTEEDTTEHNPPTYSQIYPYAEENSSQNCADISHIDSSQSCMCSSCAQNYSTNSNTQSCQFQSCTQNLSTVSACTQNCIQSCVNNSCTEGCDCCSISPHCEYCTCSQEADNNGIVDIEIHRDTSYNNPPVSNINTLRGVTSSQTRHSVLSYPIIIKNGDRTINVSSNRNGILSGNLLCGQCESMDLGTGIRPSRSRQNCYEVTVNLEWI